MILNFAVGLQGFKMDILVDLVVTVEKNAIFKYISSTKGNVHKILASTFQNKAPLAIFI